MMHQDIERVLVTEEELQAIAARLGAQISKDYLGKNLLLIGILRGSVVFLSDLMRHITVPCRVDFMSVSSYGSGVNSTGIVKIVHDLDIKIDGCDVLIVEDILDTGRTLSHLKELLSSRHPNSIRICTCLDKPDRRVNDLTADYCGVKIPDEYVVGYGLDYDNFYRNLPYVGVLKPSVYGG